MLCFSNIHTFFRVCERENILTLFLSNNAGSPFSPQSVVFSANCPISAMGTEVSLCAASLPAALKLKFTLFVDTVHQCCP